MGGFTGILIKNLLVLSGICLYSLYGSHPGIASERLLYSENRTNRVCYNDSTVKHNTFKFQRNTVPYNTVQFNTVQYNTF